MYRTAFNQAARLQAARRFQSSSSAAFLSQKKKDAFSSEARKKAWFSDPSTYPLIAVMGIAGFLVAGVGSSCLLYNPDVQISPNKRGSIMRN
jgi:hypothetical protein